MSLRCPKPPADAAIPSVPESNISLASIVSWELRAVLNDTMDTLFEGRGVPQDLMRAPRSSREGVDGRQKQSPLEWKGPSVLHFAFQRKSDRGRESPPQRYIHAHEADVLPGQKEAQRGSAEGEVTQLGQGGADSAARFQPALCFPTPASWEFLSHPGSR